jgi:uncharacterized membrane protein
MNIVLLICILIVLFVFSLGVKINVYPNEIGSYFGYRSKNSMRSEHTWLEANGYAGQCLMLASPLQMLVLVLTETYLPSHPTRIFVILVLSIFITLFTTYFLTESRLSRLFFKDGKRRPNN